MRIGRSLKRMKKWLMFIAPFMLFACSTAEEPNNTSEELSLNDAIAITSDLTKRLLEEYEVTIEHEHIHDAKQLEEIWSHYATTNYIETTIEQNYPSESCTDAHCSFTALFSLNFMTSWEPEVEIITNSHFRLAGLFPPSEQRYSNQSQKIVVEAMFDNKQWKINAITLEKRDINVQSEQVSTYLLYVYELEITDFSKVNVSIPQQPQQLAYQFVNPNEDKEYVLIAKTGILLPTADIQ